MGRASSESISLYRCLFYILAIITSIYVQYNTIQLGTLELPFPSVSVNYLIIFMMFIYDFQAIYILSK